MPAESLKGSRTAVFSASMLEDYSRMVAMDPENAERTAVTGSSVACIIPNRISWFFDLRGPSVHVNTACSGSLTAVDMACKTLESGDASCVSFSFHSDSLALILSLFSLPLSQYLTARRPSLPDPTCLSIRPSFKCYRARVFSPLTASAIASTTVQTGTQEEKAF